MNDLLCRNPEGYIPK